MTLWHPDINWCRRCDTEEAEIMAWSSYDGCIMTEDVCEACAREIAASAAAAA